MAVIKFECYDEGGNSYPAEGYDWLEAIERVECLHNVKIVGYNIV